jgi:outer membrane lipoprotein carrier protein
MKRRTFAALSLLTLAAPLIAGPSQAQQKPAATAALSLSGDEVATKVQVVYDKLSTYKATFKQRYMVKAYDKTKDSTGSVMFEKPGKMSWRYTSNGNRVVSDGKVIKIYEKDNNQMYEQPLNKTQYPAALSFLTGQGKLKENFKFTKQDSTQMKYTGGYVLLGEPLQPTAAYDKVYFYVDAKTFHVRRVIILDAQGNRNRFDFESPQANTKPPQGEFVFTPPPGTQIIKP